MAVMRHAGLTYIDICCPIPVIPIRTVLYVDIIHQAILFFTGVTGVDLFDGVIPI